MKIVPPPPLLLGNNSFQNALPRFQPLLDQVSSPILGH